MLQVRQALNAPPAMKLTGIADEAGADIQLQIKAVQSLGWNAIELRNAALHGSTPGSIHEIPEDQFLAIAETIEQTGVTIPAIGSTIANWARSIEEPFSVTLEQLERVIPRAKRLGTQFIRIMSYAVLKAPDGSDAPDQMRDERIRRLREIHARLTDAGLTPVHENCMNYGGMGISYTQDLLEAIPNFKLVFDTANPVFNRDRDYTGAANPAPMQCPWAFYQAVRDHVIHVHIKDCVWNPDKNDADYTWPGEGHGRVRDILSDLKQRAYTGWISIEPHMAVVFHDTQTAVDSPEMAAKKAAAQYDNFVAYGQRLEHLIASL